MDRSMILATSILWAAAIVASAILSAQHTMTFVVLPTLASAYLVVATRGRANRQCRDTREASA